MTTTAPPRPAAAVAEPASVAAPEASARSAVRTGVVAGMAAYLLWGFVPLYFKLVAHVPPIVVLSHRILWSALFVGIILTTQRRWGEVRAAVRRRTTLLGLVASTVMIAVNWYVFLWAITHDQVMQAGLGYFINPLVSVLLGIVFLRERLAWGQAAALLLATAGVMVQVVARGSFPWVALSLAWSFAFYALLRKTVSVGPMVGLFVETALLVPVAAYFVARYARESSQALSGTTYALLALSGVITAVPLILFATAARRLTMATMGFMQFVSPSTQLLLAVFAFREPFTRWHLTSFGLIWLALVLYCVQSLRAYREAREELTCAEA